MINRWRQYLQNGIYTITAFKTDSLDVAEDFLKDADISFADDYLSMSFEITEFAGSGDIGEYVRLVENEHRNVERNASFCNRYMMRVLNKGFKDWHLIKADIALNERYMRLYYFRFEGENGRCDAFETVEIRYPPILKFTIKVTGTQGAAREYLINVESGDIDPAAVTIKEISQNTLLFTHRLFEDKRGLYIETTEERIV